jgi:pyruvate dehydrogenase E2 component (dihydrolipoamide acetyltransferase)
MTEVIMPKMGDGMEEGTLLEWLKKDGESVKSGEVIGNIQTDKATLELESPGSGVLTGFLIKEGDTVPVGQPIAAILAKGESLPANWGSGKALAAVAADAPAAAAAGTPFAPAATQEFRVKASPLARKIAQEAGLDLAGVAGSGPGGRVTEKDVRAALAKGPAIKIEPTKDLEILLPAASPVVSSPVHVFVTPNDTKVPLTRLRGIIAQRTQQSKQEVPHFYVTVEVDVEAIAALRDMFKKEESGNVSVNDFVVKATANALRKMPELNSTFMGDHVLIHGAVHIGMAAAVNEGLLVPVVKNADQLTLREVAAKSKELVGKARDGKLGLDDMSGSTFSLTNMGMLNVDNFGAIINQPNSGIIAISSARKVPVVMPEGSIVARSRMNLTGSFDHRVVDGAVGAAFMNLVRDYLQKPTSLLS